MPWRRVYGFAQNSHMLDRGFLYCSSTLVVVWLLVPFDLPHATLLLNYVRGNYVLLLSAFGSVVILFLAGELDRKDRKPIMPKYNLLKYPLFFLGIIFLGSWLFLFSGNIESNLGSLFSDPLLTVLGALIAVFVGIGTIVWHRAKGNPQ